MAEEVLTSLAQARREFVDLWGQMAPHWGISRAMAQIHAVLMVWPSPMTAEQIMIELHISRGSVSMVLRDLETWGIVRRSSNAGDRKDYFSSEDDVWTIFSNIFRERKRRELDPLMNRLDQCLILAGAKPTDESERLFYEAYVRRLESLAGFFRVFHRLLSRALSEPPQELARLTRTLEEMI
ncbi:MAG: MarR family transcriptional regulator [Phycisphaerales bacterium]|nr:MarR family transcriptional regulator [Phycisphaerales bacterium]